MSLTIHFLNAGKGSCSILDFPSGNLTMMDIDNSRLDSDGELTDPVAYLKKERPNRTLFRSTAVPQDRGFDGVKKELARGLEPGRKAGG